jgi:hypothetical protein
MPGSMHVSIALRTHAAGKGLTSDRSMAQGCGVPVSAQKRALAWAALEAVHAELTRRHLGCA